MHDEINTFNILANSAIRLPSLIKSEGAKRVWYHRVDHCIFPIFFSLHDHLTGGQALLVSSHRAEEGAEVVQHKMPILELPHSCDRSVQDLWEMLAIHLCYLWLYCFLELLCIVLKVLSFPIPGFLHLVEDVLYRSSPWQPYFEGVTALRGFPVLWVVLVWLQHWKFYHGAERANVLWESLPKLGCVCSGTRDWKSTFKEIPVCWGDFLSVA